LVIDEKIELFEKKYSVLQNERKVALKAFGKAVLKHGFEVFESGPWIKTSTIVFFNSAEFSGMFQI